MQIRISESQIKLADVVEQLSGEGNLEVHSPGQPLTSMPLQTLFRNAILRIEEIWKNKRTMHQKKTAKQTECGNPPLMATPVAAGFPSPAEQYIESPLDLNELLVHRPAATFLYCLSAKKLPAAPVCSRIASA